jgi:hypothetical protein
MAMSRAVRHRIKGAPRPSGVPILRGRYRVLSVGAAGLALAAGVVGSASAAQPVPGGSTAPPVPIEQPGTWTAVSANPSNGGAGTFMWLLSDGSILSSGADLHDWVKLVPDAKGDYATGTWVHLGTSPFGFGAAQEQILPDGRFYQGGGEYVYQFPSGSSANDHNSTQLYDPVTNTWTRGPSGLFGHLVDSGTAQLADGRFLSGDQSDPRTQIFNPKTDTWSQAGTRPKGGVGEDGMIALPDGSVLDVGGGGSARYDATTNTWSTTAANPAGYDGTIDTSMITYLYNGKLLAMGNNKSFVYTPGSTPSSPGSWAAGPALPKSTYADDVYTTPESNGKVLLDAAKCSWVTNACGSASANIVVEYDPATNTMKELPPPPDGAPVNFINLPNGQVLAAGNRNWVYTPVGGPQNSWRPTVTAVSSKGNGSYHLTGTQLTGLVSVGEDDYQNPQNYPIVYLTDNSGKVYYARTSNFGSMTISKPGQAGSADFTLPSGLPHGTYQLYVSACGVSSASGYAFTW